MGIFKPKMLEGNIVVYTKWCIECEQPKWLALLNSYATTKNLTLQIIRTQYSPPDHKKATEIWSSRPNIKPEDAEKYSTFVVMDGVYTMKEFREMITDAKNKLVKEGEAKDDVQRLPKTKRSRRKNRVAVPVSEN